MRDYKRTEKSTLAVLKRPDYAYALKNDTLYHFGGRLMVLENDPVKGELIACPVADTTKGLSSRCGNDIVVDYRDPQPEGYVHDPKPLWVQLSRCDTLISAPAGFHPRRKYERFEDAHD